MISNLSLERVNKIANTLIKDEIVIDLIELFPQVGHQVSLGYYFCDRQERIIAGKAIALQNEEQKMPQSCLTIPFQEIPENAVTISFFCD